MSIVMLFVLVVVVALIWVGIDMAPFIDVRFKQILKIILIAAVVILLLQSVGLISGSVLHL